MSNWPMVALGELIESARVRRAGDSDFPLLSMTMHEGLVLQSARFEKRIASRDTGTYKVVKRGQLVVGFPIDEGVLDFQNVCDEGIVSPAYQVWNIRAQEAVDASYLGKYLKSAQALNYYLSKLQGSTARRRSLPQSVFLEMGVPLPPIDEQRRIAAILESAEGFRKNVASACEAVSGLTSRSFERIFSANQTRHIKLSELAQISSGITIGRKLRGDTPTTETPYLAVSNVKDRHLNLQAVRTVAATAQEQVKFALAPGDLLLTEGGDPDKLGRGTLWNGEVPGMIHQNHIFRVRLKEGSEVSPIFLSWFTSSREARAYFLRNAKQTTGIASINKTQLGNLAVAVPSKRQQDSFERVARTTEVHAKRLSKRAEHVDSLVASLRSRAFRGEL